MIRKRNGEILLRVLKVLRTGVVFSLVSVLAPQFPYLLLKAKIKQMFNEDYKPRQLRDSVKYLKKRKFIAFQKNRFIVSRLGRKYLTRREVLSELDIEKIPWDNRWRIVSFDIPKELTKSSFVLRDRLKQLGFFHFQRSVFINPFPCEKVITRLAEELGVESFVHVLVADRFENDKKILKIFGL